MSNDSIDRLCENCGEAFATFLHEMAEKNAKIATCPKCGKIHTFANLKPGKPAIKTRSLKKASTTR
jgi:uncharacterized Zn finger protein